MLVNTKVNSNPWLPYHQPNAKARLRLFCFPYAGGSAMIYRNWLQDLPSSVDVCPIQLPGRANRFGEKPFCHLQTLVQHLIKIISPYLDLPFAIFGHSMGALISFELARQLHKQKNPNLAHLFISGHRAPHIPDPNQPIYQLPESMFIEQLHQRYEGIPDSILEQTELLQFFLPMLRADFEMIETYAYTEDNLLNCPISVFGGLQDPEVSPEHLMAWRTHTKDSFKLKMFTGDHFFLNENRFLLLQEIEQDLMRVGRDGYR